MAAGAKVAKKGKGKVKGKSSDTAPVITVNSRRPDTGTELFDEYLRSEIAKIMP